MVKFTSGFDRTFYDGEYVELDLGAMTARATIWRDDSGDAPDERDDGFWPSLDPEAAGFIGLTSKNDNLRLARATDKAGRILAAWKRDEWFFCGVAVTVRCGDVRLTGKYDHALWGVECNYPIKIKGKRNQYLMEVANDLLAEAIAAAVGKVEALHDAVGKLSKMEA